MTTHLRFDNVITRTGWLLDLDWFLIMMGMWELCIRCIRRMSVAVSGGRHLFAATEAWDNNWQLLTICQESQHCHFQAQSGESRVLQADYLTVRECNIILVSVTIFPSWTEDDTIKMSSGRRQTSCVWWLSRCCGLRITRGIIHLCLAGQRKLLKYHYSPVPVWNCDSSAHFTQLPPAAMMMRAKQFIISSNIWDYKGSFNLLISSACIAQLLVAIMKNLTSQH